ncbi:MAG: Mov34/MPN/PAD-1 family protein [Gammaproteobacteria bacterium]|nr:Mov34/MPN/PAD-1 family protein [Gammaproteobacteria bacterium]MDE0246389.1 Mov34/MPN/PAD-1 family protein [Gammaproteobacteria bacterium]
MKTKRDTPVVRVEIAGEVLESVFEECDRYDHEETGGRVIGHSAVDRGALVVRATGVIEPGPRARRTRTSFFQDGDHQTKVFRRIEAEDPSIEHLGNWHTHHMNGYPTLSAGDRATYRRIVNHELHNLDFFYALLVTHRTEGGNGLDRYAVRHYVLFRGDDAVHEIGQDDVKVTNQPRIWPAERRASDNARREGGVEGDGTQGSVAVRARDQVVFGALFPSLEPRLSTPTGTFFWKGQLPLIDGSVIDVRVAEVEDNGGLFYYPFVSPSSKQVAELCETPFTSAADAVRALELRMNRNIYESAMTR